MRKIFLFLSVISTLVVISLIISCEKHTLNDIYGKYTLINYSIDGIDSINSFKDSLGTRFRFDFDDVENENICIIDGSRNDGQGTLVTWNWNVLAPKIVGQDYR